MINVRCRDNGWTMVSRAKGNDRVFGRDVRGLNPCTLFI